MAFANLARACRSSRICDWLCRPNIAVARLEVTEGRVVLVNSDRAVSTHRWLSPKDAGVVPSQ